MSLFARLLLDLRCVEQRRNHRRRTDPYRDASLHQLRAAFLARLVVRRPRRSWPVLYGVAPKLGSRMTGVSSHFPTSRASRRSAADPEVHAALSASAGTGKTQVLTARVLRLLLQGARPESILCLTFTKAAAAEMANRIGARLAAWVRLPDKQLKKDLFALGERERPEDARAGAPAVCRVLDCPGGLKDPDDSQLRPGAARGLSRRSRHRPGFPADRGQGRAGTGAADARRADGRRRGGRRPG